jgi:hypothetical protein
MTTRFRSTYSEPDAFYLRADLPQFGLWDSEDPVSHAILDLVEAQRELSDLFSDDAEYGLDCEAAFKATIKKRYAAREKLMEALADRYSWPDPDLGH